MYTRGRPGHAVHPFLCYICPEKELLDTSSRLSVPVSSWIVVVAMPYHCLFFFLKKKYFSYTSLYYFTNYRCPSLTSYWPPSLLQATTNNGWAFFFPFCFCCICVIQWHKKIRQATNLSSVLFNQCSN